LRWKALWFKVSLGKKSLGDPISIEKRVWWYLLDILAMTGRRNRRTAVNSYLGQPRQKVRTLS
jgi:hypothetical protein